MKKKYKMYAILSLAFVGLLSGCVPESKEMAPGADDSIEDIHNIRDDERDIKGEDGIYLGNLDVKEG